MVELHVGLPVLQEESTCVKDRATFVMVACRRDSSIVALKCHCTHTDGVLVVGVVSVCRRIVDTLAHPRTRTVDISMVGMALACRTTDILVASVSHTL